VSGNNLFVADRNTGTVGEYNATTGATINANFITGLSTPLGIAVSGNNLFVDCDAKARHAKSSSTATRATDSRSSLTGIQALRQAGLNRSVAFAGDVHLSYLTQKQNGIHLYTWVYCLR
jgi:hypothetical protein